MKKLLPLIMLCALFLFSCKTGTNSIATEKPAPDTAEKAVSVYNAEIPTLTANEWKAVAVAKGASSNQMMAIQKAQMMAQRALAKQIGQSKLEGVETIRSKSFKSGSVFTSVVMLGIKK